MLSAHNEIKCHVNQANSCWDISVWADRQTSISDAARMAKNNKYWLDFLCLASSQSEYISLVNYWIIKTIICLTVYRGECLITNKIQSDASLQGSKTRHRGKQKVRQSTGMRSIHFQPYITPPGGSSVQLCIHGKLQNQRMLLRQLLSTKWFPLVWS